MTRHERLQITLRNLYEAITILRVDVRFSSMQPKIIDERLRKMENATRTAINVARMIDASDNRASSRNPPRRKRAKK